MSFRGPGNPSSVGGNREMHTCWQPVESWACRPGPWCLFQIPPARSARFCWQFPGVWLCELQLQWRSSLFLSVDCRFQPCSRSNSRSFLGGAQAQGLVAFVRRGPGPGRCPTCASPLRTCPFPCKSCQSLDPILFSSHKSYLNLKLIVNSTSFCSAKYGVNITSSL